MKVLERGTVHIDEFGNVTIRGWQIDTEGKSIDLDNILRWILKNRQKSGIKGSHFDLIASNVIR